MPLPVGDPVAAPNTACASERVKGLPCENIGYALVQNGIGSMGKRIRASKQPRPEILPNRPPTSIVRHACWLVPFVLFLVVRLFSADPYYLLGGDQCTFLELGRTFPKHQLFNHELYLIHPPLFGYAIGLFNLFLPLLASGLVATLLFACVNFFAVRELGRFEKLPRTAIFVGLIYLALNRPAVAYDYHVARVSPLVCATALAILAFLRLLREPGRKALVTAIAANAFALFVTDQALLLLPCEAALLWARGPRRQWRLASLLAACSVLAALLWPVVRLIEFWRRADLPAGIDGTIEFTRNFPLLALIQPNFLPFTNTHRSLFTQTSLSLWNLKPVLLLGLPTDLLLVPREVSASIVLLLMAAALAHPGSRRRALQWLALSLLFMLPVGLGMNEWYGMGFIVPFALLMMEGAAGCLAWAGSFARYPDSVFTLGLSLACVLAAALWLTLPPPGPRGFLSPAGGTHFLFTRPAVTRAAAISRFFASMPRDVGIMAPQGLTPEVVFLTDKRVVALPFDPALLDRFIEEYHISYLLTSSEHLSRYESPVADQYTGHLVTRYIFEHPARYRLVTSLHEDYPDFYPPLDYSVFRVPATDGK